MNLKQVQKKAREWADEAQDQDTLIWSLRALDWTVDEIVDKVGGGDADTRRWIRQELKGVSPAAARREVDTWEE